jgi:hypothetical protein
MTVFDELVADPTLFSKWATEEQNIPRYTTEGFADAVAKRMIPDLAELIGQPALLLAEEPRVKKAWLAYAAALPVAFSNTKIPVPDAAVFAKALKWIPWHSNKVMEIVQFAAAQEKTWRVARV